MEGMTLILSSESRSNIFFDKKVVTCHPLYHNFELLTSGYICYYWRDKTIETINISKKITSKWLTTWKQPKSDKYTKSTEKQQFLSIMCFLTNILAGRSVFKVKKKDTIDWICSSLPIKTQEWGQQVFSLSTLNKFNTSIMWFYW